MMVVMGKNRKADGSNDEMVRASGVLPFRADGNGGFQVLVIHRPRYDDWSFPKGKVEPGETDQQCALRELAEETGVIGGLGLELPKAEYVDHKGRPKEVRYWLMLLDDDQPAAFVPNEEVDVFEWCASDKARQKLSYPVDQRLLDDAVAAIHGEVSCSDV